MELNNLNKYPTVNGFDIDLQVMHRVTNRKQYLDHVSGSIGYLTLTDIMNYQYNKDYFTFDFDIIGKAGCLSYVIMVKPYSKYKKYLYYFKDWLMVLNNRILHTLAIWQLADFLPGAYPEWKNVKVIRKLNELFRKFRKS